MYRMFFLSVEVPRNCPVEGCNGGGVTSACRYQRGIFVIPPGALPCVREATLALTAYLVGTCKAQFF